MSAAFRIIEDRGNRLGTLPPHWDVIDTATGETVVSVWHSRAVADAIVTGSGDQIRAAILESRAVPIGDAS